MEVVVVLMGLIFLILPVVALITALSSRSALLKRIEKLEQQVKVLRATVQGPDPAPQTQPASERQSADAKMTEPVITRPRQSIPEPHVIIPEPRAIITEIPPPAIAPEPPATIPQQPAPAVPLKEPEEEPHPLLDFTRPPRQSERPRTGARPPKVAKPSKTSQELEALVGGRILNLIGAVALIIGIGFFLKYAFDNNWISETVRAMIGGAVGIGLLVLGAVSNKKGYKVFSQGLIGAGISALYLSVYAAFNYYHIGLSQTAAFIMMAAVTVIAFHQAFTYDSFAVAFLGLIGGFLTPLLLSTGTGNEVGLFTYLVLLDAGILAIAARKRSWDALISFSFIGTILLYVGWYDKYYLPTDRVITVIYVTIFWLLYYATDILAQRRTDEKKNGTAGHIVAIFNMLCYYAALYTLLEDRKNPWLVGATVALGAAYILPIFLPAFKTKAGSFFAERNLIGAMALFALAAQLAPLAAETEYIRLLIWTALGVVFIWIGTRMALRTMWAGGLLLFIVVLAGSELYDTIAPLLWTPPYPVVYRVDLVLAFLAVALHASAWIAGSATGDLRGSLGKVLRAGFCATVFLLLFHVTSHQVEGYAYAGSTTTTGEFSQRLLISPARFEFLGSLWESIVWLGYALLLLWRGVRRKEIVMIYAGVAVLAIAMVLGAASGITYEPIESFVAVLNIRALALAAAAVAGMIAMRMIRRFDFGDTSVAVALSKVLEIAVVLLIFEFLSVELNDLFGRMAHDATIASGGANITGQLARFQFLQIMWESLVLMAFALPLLWRGLRRKDMVAMYSGLAMLTIAMILAVFRGIAYEPVGSFVAVLNIRALALAAAAAAGMITMRMIRRFDEARWLNTLYMVTQIAVVMIIFELLTVETNDLFNHMIQGTIAVGRGANLENMKQIALSGIWLCYSALLMVVGIARSVRVLRIIAFGLFGLTILKIFIYDLSFLDTLYRIFSFIGLGVILLLISFLYGRYKDLIFGARPEEAIKEPEEIAREEDM
ncbi:MAG: hypothetical protein JWQ98_324 [Chlorobi bacterium]|nr:hypothetical protein [Chlorobiota bacterium]